MHSTSIPFHQWKIGASIFSAWPEKGARLVDWKIQLAGQTPRSVIYWPEDADLSNSAQIRGGNPILFPFVARTFHEGKENMWQHPDGRVTPMPRHGFARNGTFSVTDTSDTGFTATLKPTPADTEVYPFQYDFSVKYTFSELSFAVDLILRNKDSQPLPWCAGHHFYFQLPWHPNLSLKDYRIDIPAKQAFHHLPDGTLQHSKAFTSKKPATSFDTSDLVDRIHTKLQSNTISFGPKGGEENILISLPQQSRPPTWNAITTWTEKPNNSPFYCVEPWMGPPNSPEHKNGLHTVLPGQSQSFSVTVTLA